MDERLIGKWYKDEMGETLNIFGETPLRMKMSFTSSGHYNFEPNCVYEKDGDLCFEINDEIYRMVYHVHYDDGLLKGYYTQFGKSTEVTYIKQSDTPDDEKYKFIPTEINVAKSEKTREELLKEYALYAPCGTAVPESTYKLYGEKAEILDKYGFDSYFEGIADGSDEIAFAALDFICDNFGHNGSGGLSRDRSLSGIISFCESHEGKTNCRGLAIMLSEVLRMKGIKARHITCKPYEDPFEDCHVVTDCLLPSGRRIMLDPTSYLYYTDENGEYVSLKSLREMLLRGDKLIPCAKASYNKGPFDADGNIRYMTKNTFRFSRGFDFADGADDHGIDLIPAKYADLQADGCPFTTDENDFWKM